MKKQLLSLAVMSAATMMAQADTVAFVAAGKNYTGAGKVTTLPTGLVGSTLPLTSDAVMISGFEGTESAVVSGAFQWNGTTAKITPADGVTITKVTIHGVSTRVNNSALTDFTGGDSDDIEQTWSGSLNTTLELTPDDNLYFGYAEIEYTGAPKVKMPEISADYSYVIPADKNVTITAESGAKIYYTTDGTEPTTESTLYSAPFALEKTSYVRAIAVAADGSKSFPTAKGYVVVPAGFEVATFDFSRPATITAEPDSLTLTNYTEGDTVWTADPSSKTNYLISVNGVKLLSGKASFTATGERARLYWSNSLGGITNLRMSAEYPAVFGVEEGCYIKEIVITGSVNDGWGIPDDSEDSSTGIKSSDDNGTVDTAPIFKSGKAKTMFWEAKDGVQLKEVTLKEKVRASAQQVEQVYVVYAAGGESGINSAVVDNSNAPVEYYNLQGVRVVNPTRGIYVMRQGNKATKVLLK